MTLEHILSFVEVGLLVWIVIQGEYIRYYEQGVYKLQSEREQERRLWRQAKQKAQLKKVEVNAAVESKKEPNEHN